MSRSRQYNYCLRIDTKVYTANVLIFCLWVLIDLKKIIMTYAEVRERSCNKNLGSYTFLPLHTLENLFLVLLCSHKPSKNQCIDVSGDIMKKHFNFIFIFRYARSEFYPVSFRDKRKKVLQNVLAEERSNLGFSLTS